MILRVSRPATAQVRVGSSLDATEFFSNVESPASLACSRAVCTVQTRNGSSLACQSVKYLHISLVCNNNLKCISEVVDTHRYLRHVRIGSLKPVKDLVDFRFGVSGAPQ